MALADVSIQAAEFIDVHRAAGESDRASRRAEYAVSAIVAGRDLRHAERAGGIKIQAVAMCVVHEIGEPRQGDVAGQEQVVIRRIVEEGPKTAIVIGGQVADGDGAIAEGV